MKKILLLGSNGQLGSDIVKIFTKSENINLLPIYRKDLDIEKWKTVYRKLKKYTNIDYIINCASYNKTDECENNIKKTFDINSLAVQEIARFCSSRDITLIHISSDYVFDGNKNSPYNEEDTTKGLNVYGLSKLAGEDFAKHYAKKHFIFRVSSLFGIAGSTEKNQNFVEKILKYAKEKKQLKIVADQFMSPTHTLDVARAIKVIIINEIKDYGIYHVCNSGFCSWYEFAKTILEFSSNDANLSKTTYNKYVTKAKRPKYSVLNNAKISKYYKMPMWKKALQEYLNIRNSLEVK